MVDIASLAAEKGSIDDVVSIKSKIVAVTHAELVVRDFSFVSDWIPNFFAYVLNYDVLRGKSIFLSSFEKRYAINLRLAGKEAVSVDFTYPNLNKLGTLFSSTVLHGCVYIVPFVGLYKYCLLFS